MRTGRLGLLLGTMLGALLAPTADAEWIHQQSGKSEMLDKTITATRAFSQVFVSNDGVRVHGGGDAWSKGSSIKFGAGIGNTDSTTSTWMPEPEEPLGEIEWSGQIDMDLSAKARSGESAAVVMAEAKCRIFVDTQLVLEEKLVHTLGIESEEDIITSIQFSQGGIGVTVPISISTGHGEVELSDSLLIPDGCRCGKSTQVIRYCYSYNLTHANGWYSWLLDIGREAEATTDVDAQVKDKVYYINLCGK